MPAATLTTSPAASSSSAMAPSTRCLNASPAGVSATRRVVRSKSCTPSSRSKRRTATDSGGWVMCSRSAARPKWSSSATTRKYGPPDLWRQMPNHCRRTHPLAQEPVDQTSRSRNEIRSKYTPIGVQAQRAVGARALTAVTMACCRRTYLAVADPVALSPTGRRNVHYRRRRMRVTAAARRRAVFSDRAACHAEATTVQR